LTWIDTALDLTLYLIKRSFSSLFYGRLFKERMTEIIRQEADQLCRVEEIRHIGSTLRIKLISDLKQELEREADAELKKLQSQVPFYKRGQVSKENKA